MHRDELVNALRTAGRFADERTTVEAFVTALLAELENPHTCAADYTRTWCVTCGRRMGPR